MFALHDAPDLHTLPTLHCSWLQTPRSSNAAFSPNTTYESPYSRDATRARGVVSKGRNQRSSPVKSESAGGAAGDGSAPGGGPLDDVRPAALQVTLPSASVLLAHRQL